MRSVLVTAIASALVSCFCFCGTSQAASAGTDAFLANVRLGASYLSAASSLAGSRSESGALRGFAANEHSVESRTIAELDAWQASVAVAESSLPMTVAGIDDVRTGRSVAKDPAVEKDRYSSPAGTGAMMPAATIALDHLAAAKGPAFDSLYKKTQLQALLQLSGFFNAYSLTGDDPALRAMAAHHLADTKQRIAEIGRL